ncbi:hypothetical protein Theam_0632 [Thermovibrio ammonificans HB-1]|uniref:PD-(D/E)XK endonuclease-like domain-containing protein n=1 Tax=Thermovibrio ammonificans (strain DSM 15698 / JCM 12110 / HB-1) TaxID=648996 RepID=E8T619_THEA1|nr:PD-(D/E)XK nuclease family protein [Thermovibrio ammonificans]ADU96603.1 hypothetical protein Theam_0632 [Thermovibrio ammonificans HB-1]
MSRKRLKELVEELSQKIERNENPFVVVRQFTTFFEVECLRSIQSPVFKEIGGTLQRAALKVLEENLEKRRILSDQERTLLVKRIVEEVEKAECSYGRAQLIDKRIRGILQSGTGEEELLSAAEQIEDSRLKEKLLQTVELVKRFQELQKELTGRSFLTVLKEATERLESSPLPFSSLEVAAPVFLFPLETAFLKKCPHTLYFYRAEGELQGKLQEEFLKDSVNVRELEGNSLSRALNRKPAKSETEVLIKSVYTENEHAVAAVEGVLLALERGVEPHRIAVVGDSIDRLLPVLYSLFKQFKIPFNFQTRGLPLTSTAVVKEFLHEIRESEESLPLTEWLRRLWSRSFRKSDNLEKQLLKLLREIEGLSERGLFLDRRLNGPQARKELLKLLQNRFYMTDDNDPFGVHVCSPESAVSLFPEAVIFIDLSEGSYPRAFPYDPDFSYAEREQINRLLKACGLSNQPFPSRKNLIAYDFLTFHNILSLPLKLFFATVNRRRGESLFTYLLREFAGAKEAPEFATREAVNAFRVYKGEREPETEPERGIVGWKDQGPERAFLVKGSKALRKRLKEITVSQLLSYLRCPTEAFIELFLTPDTQDSIFSAEGTLYHRLIAAGDSWEEEFDREFERLFSRLKAGEKKLEILKEALKKNFSRFIKKAGPIEGKHEEELAVTVEGTVIRGRADLIVEAEKLKIVDFKRGSVKVRVTDSEAIQLLLYAAAKSCGELESWEPQLELLELELVSVSRSYEAGWRNRLKLSKGEVEKVKKLVRTAVRGMKLGIFVPHRLTLRRGRIGLNTYCCRGFERFQLSFEELKRVEKLLRGEE